MKPRYDSARADDLALIRRQGPYVRTVAAIVAGALAWLVLFRFMTYQQRNRMPDSTWVIFAGICLLAGFGLAFGMTEGRKRVIHCFWRGSSELISW